MIGLTSRTGTKTTIAALSAAGWGWIVGPLDMGGPIRGNMPHGVDNGAWPAFQQNVEWDADAFVAAVDRYGPGSLFIVVPDIVMGGAESLRRSREWLPILSAREDIADVPLLIAVQNGMTPDDVDDIIGGRVGLFVGGDTEWKEMTMPIWGRMAAERDVYLHIGRANSGRRIALCAAAGANSFDGTSPILFPKTLPLLDRARRQRDLFAR